MQGTHHAHRTTMSSKLSKVAMARVGFELATLRTQGTELTIEPSHIVHSTPLLLIYSTARFVDRRWFATYSYERRHSTLRQGICAAPQDSYAVNGHFLPPQCSHILLGQPYIKWQCVYV